MKLFLMLLSTFVFSASQARADAELKLYNGHFEFDLKQTITISLSSGQLTVQNYKKVCSAYNGCKAVATDQLKGVTGVDEKDLEDLKSVVVSLDVNAEWIEESPSKNTLCIFFNRFAYQLTDTTGDTVKVAEFQDCVGKHLNNTQAKTIERVLNIAASNAGL